MDMVIQLLKDNFVFIVLVIVLLVMIRVIMSKVFTVVGALLIAGLVYYGITGDISLMNKTVDNAVLAVDMVKEEVGTVDFERTSDTTFTLKTTSMTVSGDEESRIATVTLGDSTFDVPLKNIYNVLDEATQAKINME